MPHCIIEYSKELEYSLPIKELLKLVHVTAFESGLFEESSIKTRAIAYGHYQTGNTTTLADGPFNGLFVHINLKILYGRNHQQKKDLSRLMLASVQAILTAPISLSVEVSDIDKVCYAKVVL